MACVTVLLGTAWCAPQAWAQQQATPQQGQRTQTSPQNPAQQAPRKANPFEQVEEEKKEPTPPPPGQAPSSAVQTAPGAPPPQDIIEAIEFRGARRIPQDTLRAMIFSKAGDKYDEEALRRDFVSLWNQGRFDDIRLEREAGQRGWIVRFLVTERRVVRSIKYEGAKSVTTSEILDRFKERRVGLSVETQYDPNKVQRAAVVLKELLAERGRQFATVTPEVKQIPPSSLEVVFNVNEGPKVKVGSLDIIGNKAFSDRAVIRAMKNLKPIGVPRSILFENLFSRSYDASKLEEDADRVRVFYQEHGYFTARVVDRQVNVRDVGGKGFRIPLFYPNKPGKVADLKLTIEEGRLYRLRNVNYVGVKLFRTPEALTKPFFGMDKGDVFSTAKLRKGMDQMRKYYGQFGYIDFVPEPDPEPVPNSDQIDMTVTVDEGKQFFVKRIDFQGNTTTRDKVIRRELLIDEGDMFNSHLWEVSLLRLNQLGYFEPLKQEEAATINRDLKTNTVDITLKVKERGKNSVQLSGGVSGIAGSFISFGYQTNNFLGLGETLSLDAQLGDRLRSVQFGFTEPYLFDRPIQAGFTVNTTRFNYDQAREVSLLSGRNLIPLFNQLGSNNTLNYVSTGYGFSTFASTALRRSFARVTLTYSFNVQNIKTLSDAASSYFEYINFRGIGGPNSLQGIRSSAIIPGYSYNTVDHPITPSRGKSLFLTGSFAGGPLGGNVNDITPTLDATYFRKGFKQGHVIGAHVLGRFITGYGGKVAPPFNRFYMGGEQDIRGFDIWGISPIAYVPSNGTVPVLNSDGTARVQKVIDSNGVASFQQVTQNVPVYQLTFPGGDTQVVTNFEYRIPLFGPATIAPFLDAGINKIALPSQLGLNPQRVTDLNAAFPTTEFSGRAQIAPGTQKMRMSTGIELKVLLPIVNAPFRIYWAYNPMIVRTIIQPPVGVDRTQFANEATYQYYLYGNPNPAAGFSGYGRPFPFYERRSQFRFTIGKTF